MLLSSVHFSAFAFDDYEQWYVDPQNPEVQRIIRQTCKFPLEDNLITDLYYLYHAVGRRFSYDDSFVHAWQTVPEMLRQNQGVCCDFARLYYSLLRGIGWPENRIELVYAPIYDLLGNPIHDSHGRHISHAWIEIKTPSPVGTVMSLSANESVSVFEGQSLTMGFNETVLAMPEVTLGRIQQVRTLGWGERNGWIPIDPTAGVCWSKVPLIGGLVLSILPGLYLTFGYNMFYLAGWTIHPNEVMPYYGPYGHNPRRGNPTWGSLNVTIDVGRSFNVSYLNDIQPYTLRLSLTESINSTLPVNIETRGPRMQLIQSISGVTSFNAYVDLDYKIPPFPKDLGIYWFTVHNPQSVKVNVTFGRLGPGATLAWLGSEEAINQTLYEEYSTPKPYVMPCNESGEYKNIFLQSESLYVKGGGHPYSKDVTIYILVDGLEVIPENARAVKQTKTESDGSLNPVLMWTSPLDPGHYDIWVDTNQNGVLDNEDIINDQAFGIAAFNVVPEPESIITMLVMSAAFVLFTLRPKTFRNRS